LGPVKEEKKVKTDRLSVLVADDDQSLLKLVTKVVGRMGYEVEGVTSGREVISRVTAGGNHLLLLDYNLPDMSGRQVMEKLSSLGFAVPFIVMTGHGDERLAVDMMKLGARDYVMKDVAFVDLLPTVVRQAVDQLKVERKLKVTEAGLRKSEEMFAKAFMASPNWMLILTLDDGRIVEANDTFISSSGFGRAEAIGASCRDLGLCVNPSHWKEMFSTLSSGKDFKNREITAMVKSGQKRTLLLSAEPLEFSGQQCAICVAHDITESKQDQEKIMASLREKDILLKEIHHRVKNNLQVITSLLSLQSRSMPEDKAKTVFDEVGKRIKSMALVHEMLYSADDFSRVDFRTYVSALLDNIYRHIGVSRRRIATDLRIDGIQLGIDYAVPCGLIVNELASNSLKYAYPDDAGGRLLVSMAMREEDGEDAVRLVFEDDGVGLPEGMNFASSDSLGLKLVRLLSERQLEGSASCVSDREGTRFVIEFRVKVLDDH